MISTYQTSGLLYQSFPKGGRGAEIGVCRGANASLLLHATRPVEFNLVDVWEVVDLTFIYHPAALHYGDWESDVRALFADVPGVRVHRSRGADFLRTLPDDYLDWAYLDADHSYESVAEEIELAARKVKPGGIVAGHDFMVHEKAWRSGVVRAVIEAIQAGKLEMVGITDEQFPSFACRVLE